MDNIQKLQDACQKGNLKEVIFILNENISILNETKNKKGIDVIPPLQTSIIWDNFEVADYLLSIGFDRNKKFYNSEFSCNAPIIHTLVTNIADDFYSAEGKKYPEIMDIISLEYCIKNNINVNLEDDKGFTPLDIALEYGYYTGYELLVKNNAKHSKKFFKENISLILNSKKVKGYFKIYPYLECLKLEDCIETKTIYKHPKKLSRYQREMNRSMGNYKYDLNNPELELGFLENVYKDYPHLINQKDYLGRTPLDFAIEINHYVAEEYLRNKNAKTSNELNEIDINDKDHDLIRKLVFELNFEEIKKMSNIENTLNKIYKEKYFETVSHELFLDEFTEEKKEILEYFLINGANPNLYVNIPIVFLGAKQYLQTNSNIERGLISDIIKLMFKKGYNEDLSDDKGRTLSRIYPWVITQMKE